VPDNTAHIPAGVLRQLLATASTATEKRPSVPILGHLLISADAGILTAIGTDLEERVTAYAPCTGTLSPFTISAHRANAIVESLPPDALVTLLDEERTGHVILSTTAMEARLQTLPASDFPKPRTQKAIAEWRITAGTFRDLFGRAQHAMSDEETRYYLNGVFLHVWDDVESPALRTAATDGHRLITLSAPMPEGDTPLAMIVAKDAVRQLLKLLADTPDHATLIIKQGELSLRVERPTWEHDSKAIDGTFPDYARVVPKEAGRSLLDVHDPAALSALVQQARAIGTEPSLPVTFRGGMDFPLTISARSSEEGETTVQVPPEVAAWVAGEDLQVAFQARYLADLCRALPERFTMHVIDGTAPVRATSTGAMACLMPMRLED
jgi:DNA polymerase III subunit beta